MGNYNYVEVESRSPKSIRNLVVSVNDAFISCNVFCLTLGILFFFSIDDYNLIWSTVNVDGAVDDIVRQFKGVSDGLMRKVVGSSPLSSESASLVSGRNLDWKTDEIHKLLRQNTSESANSNTDNEEGDKDGVTGYKEIGSSSGWHSDNELNSKGFPPRVVKREKDGSRIRFRSLSLGRDPVVVNPPVTSDHLEDPIGVPPEVLLCKGLFFFWFLLFSYTILPFRLEDHDDAWMYTHTVFLFSL